LELLGRHLARYRVEEAKPGETLFSADCGTERVLPGGRVLRGKHNLYWKSLKIYEGRRYDEMAARLIGFARDWATLLSNEFVRLRAGGVAIDGAALIFPANPQPHLPALMGLLVRSGARYYGDEMVNVDPILRRIHGLPLPLRIDGQDVSLFPELGLEPSREPRWKLEVPEGYEGMTTRAAVAVDAIGGTDAEPAPIGWIVFPDFEPGAETRLEPLGGAPALFRFTQSVLNLHVWEDRALVLMRDLIESAPVSRLVVGSLEEAADLVIQTAPSMVEEVRT
jgi:hypothetical protein